MEERGGEEGGGGGEGGGEVEERGEGRWRKGRRGGRGGKEQEQEKLWLRKREGRNGDDLTVANFSIHSSEIPREAIPRSCRRVGHCLFSTAKFVTNSPVKTEQSMGHRTEGRVPSTHDKYHYT